MRARSVKRGTKVPETGSSGPRMTLTLPMPPNLANARMHHMVKHRRRVQYYELCDWWQLWKKLPRPPEQAWERTQITVTAFVARRHDMGNLMHRVEKWPCDWLKTRGYIVDDSPEYLEWAGLPSQQIVKRSETRLEITLTPIVK